MNPSFSTPINNDDPTQRMRDVIDMDNPRVAAFFDENEMPVMDGLVIAESKSMKISLAPNVIIIEMDWPLPRREPRRKMVPQKTRSEYRSCFDAVVRQLESVVSRVDTEEVSRVVDPVEVNRIKAVEVSKVDALVVSQVDEVDVSQVDAPEVSRVDAVEVSRVETPEVSRVDTVDDIRIEPVEETISMVSEDADSSRKEEKPGFWKRMRRRFQCSRRRQFSCIFPRTQE